MPRKKQGFYSNRHTAQAVDPQNSLLPMNVQFNKRHTCNIRQLDKYCMHAPAGQLIKALNQLLKEHDYLPAKKRLYVEYGCRGDWPELKPKEWNPVLDSLQRKPVPEA
eukprot:GHRQ01028389.1.p3 GENE.GHRQ01028389.1~~GHRQ01028389.1.p3  ORF type:complete len:108 (+),score=27.21 GHRQ01028389.1:39-362(+)